MDGYNGVGRWRKSKPFHRWITLPSQGEKTCLPLYLLTKALTISTIDLSNPSKKLCNGDDVYLKILFFLSHQIAHTIDAGMHFQRHENIDLEYKVGHAWNKSHRELANDI